MMKVLGMSNLGTRCQKAKMEISVLIIGDKFSGHKRWIIKTGWGSKWTFFFHMTMAICSKSRLNPPRCRYSACYQGHQFWMRLNSSIFHVIGQYLAIPVAKKVDAIYAVWPNLGKARMCIELHRERATGRQEDGCAPQALFLCRSPLVQIDLVNSEFGLRVPAEPIVLMPNHKQRARAFHKMRCRRSFNIRNDLVFLDIKIILRVESDYPTIFVQGNKSALEMYQIHDLGLRAICLCCPCPFSRMIECKRVRLDVDKYDILVRHRRVRR